MIFTQQDYTRLVTLFQGAREAPTGMRPGACKPYPGYKPEVKEAPNGDVNIDTGKRYLHVALKYNPPDWAVAYLARAHFHACRVAEALGVAPAYYPRVADGTLRVLEYPINTGSAEHKDFDLFSILCWRSTPEDLELTDRGCDGAHDGGKCSQRREAERLSPGLHIGEIGELVGLRRKALYERDGYACHWCKCAVSAHTDPDRKRLHRAEATLDHKKPRSRGGDNSNGNLVTACRGCNSSRQASKRPKVRPENRALSYGALAPGAGAWPSSLGNIPASRPNKKSVDIVVKGPHVGKTGRKAPSARTGPLASSSGRSYDRGRGTVLLYGRRLSHVLADHGAPGGAATLFEAHITYSDSYREKVEEYCPLGWKFSAIDGDPVMGKEVFCYLTSYDVDPSRLLSRINVVVSLFPFPPVRKKIERIVYDTKTNRNEL